MFLIGNPGKFATRSAYSSYFHGTMQKKKDGFDKDQCMSSWEVKGVPNGGESNFKHGKI